MSLITTSGKTPNETVGDSTGWKSFAIRAMLTRGSQDFSPCFGNRDAHKRLKTLFNKRGSRAAPKVLRSLGDAAHRA